MTAELHGRYFKPELVNVKAGAEAIKAYSSIVITCKIIGCYDDRDTRSFSSLKL